MFDIIVRLLNALLMIAMPLVLGVYLALKLNVGWRLFGIGAVTFIVAQVLHIPFNYWVLNPIIEKLGLGISQTGVQLVIVAILYGLSAGVFEEVARYIFYRFWLKKDSDRTWSSAVMFGAGHGGVEAIVLGLLGLIAFVQLLVLRDADLSTQVPVDQLELAKMQVETYWALPWYAALMGAIERVAAISFHISASVLVLQVFRRRNLLWLLLAIGWHTLLDAVAVFGMQTWGMYITEALIVSLGALSVVIVFLLREPDSAVDADNPSQREILTIDIETQKPSLENLEDSRYD
jgi:uncharacterized membrane protein YhfC